ncbi:hypothetical protein NDU88_011675, partial [Pleurodeles waltl]
NGLSLKTVDGEGPHPRIPRRQQYLHQGPRCRAENGLSLKTVDGEGPHPRIPRR